MNDNKLKERARPVIQEESTDEIDLKELITSFWYHKWLIVVVMFFSFVFTVLYVIQIPPQYEATALILFENQQSGMDVLQGLGLMGDLSGGGTTAALTSQIETALMESRFILEPVIEQNHLDFIIQPDYFPIIGGYFSRHYSGYDVAKPYWGFSNFAWGGEKISIDEFNIPQDLYNKQLMLVVGDNDTYQLYDPNAQLLLTGEVGQLEKTTSNVLPVMTFRVSSLRANPGTRFYLVRQPISTTLKNLQNQLSIADQGGVGGQTSTGILQLSLKGTHAYQLPLVLNTIIKIEVQKNIEKKTAEAEQTIAFINEQLPLVQGELNRAETALSSYRAKTGTLGMSLEAQTLLGQLVDLEQMTEQLNLQKAELLLRFTSLHPLVIAVTNKQQQLKQELELLKTKISALPKKEQLAINLERDVKVKNQMYLLMLSKLQQLQVAKAGMISDVRVLNYSDVASSMPSKKPLIFAGSLLFGFILAVMIIFIRRLLSHGIDDPDYVEQHLGLPAYAIIPHSKRQEHLAREMQRQIPGMGPYVLSEVYSKDMSIEGLRSLRTTLQFSLQTAENNIICILGSSPDIGKSFISVNLAYVLAHGGKRVLLIDADMRKGKTHRYFSLKNTFGLSSFLDGTHSFDEVCYKVKKDEIDFIPSGTYPKNPSELLMNGRLQDLFSNIAKNYDIVIFDTPPILAVTDAMIIARNAATNLLLIGSAKEQLPEIDHAVKRLRTNNITVSGLVFNNTSPEKHYAYGNYRYNYYYDYEKK